MKNIIDKVKLNKNMFIIALSLLVVIGISFAFIAPLIIDGVNRTNIVAESVDKLNFEVDKDITLKITHHNLTEGGDNLVEEAVGTARLLANSATETASYNYFVYFNINKNSYIYTTEDNKAEIILKITDPNGQIITELDGLTYDETLQGFDITTYKGLIKVADYTITSGSSSNETIQNWIFTVSFINLDTNQKDNASKRLNAEVLIQRNEYEGGAEYLADHIIATYVSNDDGQPLLYHELAFADGAKDNSYRYNGANPNNFICFGSGADVCPYDNIYRIIGLFDTGNNNYSAKLIKYDYATITDLGTGGDYYNLYNADGTSKPYTYKGNNYENIVTVYWNYNNDPTLNSGNGSNLWSTSLLNTENLNTHYLNSFGSDWTNKIADTTWQVGGNRYSSIRDATAIDVFQNEIVNPAVGNYGRNETTYTAKIGLMYASDYGYAAIPASWTTTLYNYTTAVRDNNWLYMGLREWIITRNADYSNGAFVVATAGGLTANYSSRNNAVRPVFYLQPTVEFESGTGIQLDPYRIVI